MNVLLANMPVKFNSRENLEPPLGICYIGAVLKEEGHNVFLKDYEVEEFDRTKLKALIKKNKIEVLGVSFRTASYRSCKEFISAVRSDNPGLKIVIGGQHATAFPEFTLRDMRCDAAVRGEGEYVFRDFVRAVERDSGFNEVNGLTYRVNAGIVSNPDADYIKDIDKLPVPFREGLDLEKYNIITVITSRGCPYNCIYCDKGVSTRIVKYRSPEKVYDEIRHIITAFGKNRLYIVDDFFFLNRKRLEDILDRIIRDDLAVTWVCQARVDGIDSAILEKAKKSGCEQVMFGIESGDEMELKYMRKQATNEQAENAVRLTRKYGITARANFMLGFPVSTPESASNTIRFAKKLHPDIVRFFAVAPLPNTDLWRDVYKNLDNPASIKWDDIDFFKPTFDAAGLKRQDISLYVGAAYWHVLKWDFLKEITVFLVPNLAKLLYLCLKTGRVRGNISRAFPRSVNLILDNLHQLEGMSFSRRIGFLYKVWKLEKKI